MIAAIYARKSTKQHGVAEDQKSVARQIATRRATRSARGDDRRGLRVRRRWDLGRGVRHAPGVRAADERAEADRPAGVRGFFYLKDRPR